MITFITKVLTVRIYLSKLVYNSIVFILVVLRGLFVYDFFQRNIVLIIYKEQLSLPIILKRLVLVVNNILIKRRKLIFFPVKNVTVLNICTVIVVITILAI